MANKQKLYCYVDETGQDTKGDVFIVSVAVTEGDRDEVKTFLEGIEQSTGKGKTKKEAKIAYLDKVLSNKSLQHKIFYSVSRNVRAYREITLVAIASAVTASKDNDQYEARVFIDGLQSSEISRVATGLRRIGIRTEKVRGLRDESDALIRLTDAIAGFIRENEEGVQYIKRLYKLGLGNKILTRV